MLEHLARSVTVRRKLLSCSRHENETEKEACIEQDDALLPLGLSEEVNDEQYPQPVIEQIFVIIDAFPSKNSGNGSGERKREPELRTAKRPRMQDKYQQTDSRDDAKHPMVEAEDNRENKREQAYRLK